MEQMQQKHTHDRNEFSQSAALCGFGALIYFVVVTLLSSFVGWLFVQSWVQPWSSNIIVTALVQVIINAVALSTPFLLFFIKPFTLAKVHFKKPQKGTIKPAFLLFWVLIMAGNTMALLLGNMLERQNIQVFLPKEFDLLVLTWFALAVVPALGEELLFRGLLQGYLRPYGAWVAIVGQSVIFALLHGDAQSCLAALFGGVALGICAEYTQSLWWGMLFHLYNNTMAFVAQYYSQYGIGMSLQMVLEFGVPLVVLLGYLAERWTGQARKPEQFTKGMSIVTLRHSLGWVVCVVILFLNMIYTTVA